MNKVFLYLYPIEEFNKMFLFSDSFYEENNREKPFDVLNECIQKRYRDNGYQIVYALYPDKEIFGIKQMPNDKIIYTDITFKEASGYNEDGSIKSEDEIKYPNEEYLISQLGTIEHIVVGGFHWSDCVKRVAECCLENGIDTIVDLDLTDLFFGLYHQKDYFRKESYNTERYKEYRKNRMGKLKDENDIFEKKFKESYGNPIYKFYPEETQKIRK